MVRKNMIETIVIAGGIATAIWLANQNPTKYM